MENKEKIITIEELEAQIAQFIAFDPLSPPGSKPIIRISEKAKILIIGQAPGIRAQNSNLPWNDASGDRLRSWLNLSEEQFYDKNLIANMPMGFCFPGYDKYGGDKPPNILHAKMWHKPLRAHMPNIKLTLLVGTYAQKFYLQKRLKQTMTETILNWYEYLPEFFVLPHPSWRNTGWLKNNLWFEKDLLPNLSNLTQEILF